MLWRKEFWLSEFDFPAFFILRGRDTHTEYKFSAVIVSGRHDLPSYARAFSLTYFEMLNSSLRLNKGFRLFIFSKVLDLHNYKRFSWLSVNVTVSCNILSRWAQLISVLSLRPKMCRPSANTENSRRTREKPLVPRVGSLMKLTRYTFNQQTPREVILFWFHPSQF